MPSANDRIASRIIRVFFPIMTVTKTSPRADQALRDALSSTETDTLNCTQTDRNIDLTYNKSRKTIVAENSISQQVRLKSM